MLRIRASSRLYVAAALVALLTSRGHAQPSTNLDDYALFADESLKTKGLHIADGDIGVNSGQLDAQRAPAIDAPNSTVAASTVRINAVSICMQLFANSVRSSGPGCGPGTQFTVPIVPSVAAACGFPVAFPACDPNPSADINIPAGTSLTLGPGVYGDVTIRSGRNEFATLVAGTLILTGGNYVFCSLRAGRAAQIYAQNPVEIDVGGVLTLGNGSFTGPAPGASLTPADIQIFAAGTKVHFSRQSEVRAHLCAPNATLRLTAGGSHAGSFVAQRIRTERIFFPVCGDSIIEGNETCEPPGSDPPPPGGNVCRANCTYCGDGRVQPQSAEECDDGNDVDTDTCRNDCTFNPPPLCGNTVLDAGETCDPPGSDPPPAGGNLCRNDCTYCGDALPNGSEQCDDGNTDDGDACHNNCTLP
jgi:cysteine-rich repeat protein